MFLTDRLTLRKIVPADASDLFALDNDVEVMRYINGGLPTPLEFIHKKVVPLFTMYNDERPGIGYWAIIEKKKNDFIGWCCLRDSQKEENEATLGYRLSRKSWGRGYATEASSFLIQLGFGQLGLSAIKATTYDANTKSRQVLEKLGFAESRKFREDLTGQQTAYFESTESWDGWDIEYCLNKEGWHMPEET